MPEGVQIIVTSSTGQAIRGIEETNVALNELAASAKRAAGSMAASTRQVGAGSKTAAAESTAAAGAAARNWSAAGKRLNTVGRSMTRNVTLPIIAVGATAIKMSLDFDTAMNRIRNLVGASQAQVNRWSQDLLTLAPQLGKSPKELADALYFVTSSGIKASKALDVVRVSAKASALGLGDTQTVADATTSAMNAYAKSGLTAGRATNVLAQAVKLGKGEPAELAKSIGRVIPVASKLKVPFSDVGASLASMTLQGLDAAEATTALRGIFTATLKPSQDAEKALAGVGLSAAQIRTSLKEKGTLATLEMLSRAFKGNEDQIARVFPNVRALVGAFNLTGDSAHHNAQIFAEMAKSTDIVGEGFDRLQKTPAQRLHRAIATLQVAMVRLGAAIAPVVIPAISKLANVIGGAFQWFSKLPGPVKEVATDLALFTAAVGPALLVTSSLIRAIKDIGELRALGSVFSGAGKGWGRLMGKGLLIGFALEIPNIAKAITDATGRGDDPGKPLVHLPGILGDIQSKANDASRSFADFLHLPGGHISKLTELQGRLAKATANVSSTFRASRAAGVNLERSQERLTTAQHRHQHAVEDVRKARQHYNRVIKEFGPRSSQATQAEVHLAQATHREAEATREARRARHLHGIQETIAKGALTQATRAAAHDIRILKERKTHILAQARAMRERGTLEEHSAGISRRLRANQQALDNVEGKLNKTYQQAAQTIGGVFAKQLRATGSNIVQFGSRLQDIRQKDVTPLGNSIGGLGKKLAGLPAPSKRGFGALGESAQSADTTTKGALGDIVGSLNRVLKGLGVNPVNFGRKQAGGGIVVPGSGSGDKVPLTALVEPGEAVFVLNRTATAQLNELQTLNRAIPRFQGGGHMQAGGVHHPHIVGPSGGLRSLGQGIVDDVYEGATKYLRRKRRAHQAAGGAGNRTQFGKGPEGVGSYMGVPMANWVIQSLLYAASKGVKPQPTSGYRPGFDPNTVTGVSEHSGTKYPHGAVDFGGYNTGLAAKMSVVRATSNFKWPLLAPIGFHDDGHASGTGHQRGGLIRLQHGGFAGPITVKHAGASAQQLHTATGIMNAADKTGANFKARVAAIMAATQESTMGASGNTFQLTSPKSGSTPGSGAYDQALAFFNVGFYGKGGAKALSQTMGDPGAIAQAVEGSAFPGAYEQWKSEAQSTVGKWARSAGGGGGADTGPSAAQVQAKKKRAQLKKHRSKSLAALWQTYRNAPDRETKLYALQQLAAFYTKFGVFDKDQRRHLGELRHRVQRADAGTDVGQQLSAYRDLVTYERGHAGISTASSDQIAKDQQKRRMHHRRKLLDGLRANLKKAHSAPQRLAALKAIVGFWDRFGVFDQGERKQIDQYRGAIARAESTAGLGDDIKAYRALVNFEGSFGTISSKAIKQKGKTGEEATTEDTGASDASDDTSEKLSQLNDLLAEQLRITRQNLLISEAQRFVIPDWMREALPFAGAFGTGGIVPGPIGKPYYAKVHGGEAIGPAAAPVVYVDITGSVAPLLDVAVSASNQAIGRGRRTQMVAPGG